MSDPRIDHRRDKRAKAPAEVQNSSGVTFSVPVMGADPQRRATTYSRVHSMRHVYTLALALVTKGNPTTCFSITTSPTLYREPRGLPLRVGTGDLCQLVRRFLGDCTGSIVIVLTLRFVFAVSIQPHMSSISDVARFIGIQQVCRWRRRRSAVSVSHARLHLSSILNGGTHRGRLLGNPGGVRGRFGHLRHLFRHDVALSLPDHLPIGAYL